jgi:small-conductance mechanosensitive channel
MLKTIGAIWLSLLFMLFSAPNSFADHATPFDDKHEDKQEFNYQGSDMARFVILSQAKERKNELKKSLRSWPEQKKRLIHNFTNDRDSSEIFTLLGIFALMLTAGFLLERLASFKMDRVCARLYRHRDESWGDSLKLLLMRCTSQFLGLAVFAFMAGTIASVTYEDNDPFRLLALLSLTLVVKIRSISIILKLIFAPYAKELRLLGMECEDAKRLYFSILAFISLYLIITTFWRTMALFSLEPILFALVVPATGFILNIASIALIWINHKVITRMFIQDDRPKTQFIQVFSQIWPTVVSFWLLVIWSIWAVNEFLGNYQEAERIATAWWLTFSFPIIDRLLFVILSQLKRISWLKSYSYEQRCDIFIQRVMIALRVILFVVIVHRTDSSFGYNAWEMLAQNFGGFLKMSVDILIVLILAYAVWEVIQSAIERHLPNDLNGAKEDDGLSSLEGEGGGSGATRSETLLPLVRSFLLVFLIVSVLLTILSIMGVEIAPLLAGAGIIGIAVGFGAQKLVQDVISGIFFLLDDAFRRGEYIEAAGLRGTVERISIRSIRLRHHLGAVQTIPFSEIATVRNLSRDWITMKLEFRLDYRTNVETVRKLIKKEGQKMLEHPEYGKFFLLPLKSQGVIRVEESALIFRMKFTCVPGEQWIIRREAFTRVKEALKTNGIEFAHKSVHVLMQEPNLEKSLPAATPAQAENLQAQLAGAAASSVTESVRKNDRIDHNGD